MNNDNASARTNLLRTLTGPTSRVLITSFVSGLAIATLGGCSNGGKTASGNGPVYTGSGDFTPEAKASRATVAVDPAAIKGTYTSDYYGAEGSKVALPQQWVSEAVESTAEIEARRASAIAAQVRSEADKMESLAIADSDRQAALARDAAARAEAEKHEQTFNAKLNEMYSNAQAKQQSYETQAKRNSTVLSASVKEWQSEVERMRSQSEADWSRSLAEHEQMNSARKAVQDRGEANIAQMRRTHELTQTRAESKVQGLRTESQATAQQTAAQVVELAGQIDSVTQQTVNNVTDLRQQASSLREESSAYVADLMAEADALSKKDVEETYRVKMVTAKTDFDRAMAEAERLRQETDNFKTTSTAELERKRGEVRKSLDLKRADYAEALQFIDSHVEQGLADVEVARAKAERLEREARAKFVKAETEARVRAIHETSKHQVALSEADFTRIKGEADAEATRLQAQLMTEIVSQLKANQTALPSNGNPPKQGATENDPTPKMTNATAKPTVVEFARIAEFRTALADVAKLRSHAETGQNDLIAKSDEQRAGVEAWWKETIAAHDAWVAEVDAVNRKNAAVLTEKISQIESKVAAAHADRNRSQVEAEAFRKETFAKIQSLKALAESTKKKSEAKYTQLVAQAEATERNGKTQTEALAVKRDATLRRGNAKSQQLLVEADTLENSQQAIMNQMKEQIVAAETILTSELARLDQAADTFFSVSRANYDEGIAMANTFERITIANTGELAASHLAQRKTAQADVNYLRDLTTANQLVAEASVTRMIADAEAQMGEFNSDDLTRRARILAQSQMNDAATSAEFAIASADEQAIRSRFDSRIVATESDRNRAYAELFQKNQFDKARMEQALAAAATFREMSDAALARLNAANDTFNRTATANWDSRLGGSPEFPVPTSNTALYTNSDSLFNPNHTPATIQNSLTEVPTEGSDE